MDFPDFLILSNNFGQENKSWSDGDFDADGSVLFGDFLLLSNNFGGSTSADAAVPEPTYGLFVVVVIVGLADFRRYREYA